MKKIVLTLVAMMSMTMAFAGNTNAKAAEMENAYDMHINIRRLATTLGLNIDQMESVNDLYNNFCVEMLNASAAKDEEKSEMVDAAVKRNLTYMAYVLDNSQLKKYTLLLDTTLKNRGLKNQEKYSYYFGAAWSKYDVKSYAEWQIRIKEYLDALKTPLGVEVK